MLYDRVFFFSVALWKVILQSCVGTVKALSLQSECAVALPLMRKRVGEENACQRRKPQTVENQEVNRRRSGRTVEGLTRKLDGL